MWQLWMTNAAKEWVEAGSFESLREAARQIAAAESYPVSGMFFEIHVEARFGTDAEALGHLEHRGKLAAWVVKRRLQ